MAADKGFSELRQRLLFLLGAFVVFRIGAHIPVPGVDYVAMRAAFAEQGSGILEYFNLFTGGALANASIMALGIFPYITASIIMMLASYSFPKLEAMRKEGTQGRRKITHYTRLLTVPLAAFQAYGFAAATESFQLVPEPGWGFRATAMLCMVSGSIYLMWLGEQITERGLGNGVSLLIFASIVAGLPGAIGQLFEQVRLGEHGPLFVIFVLGASGAVLAFVVFIERGQRRVLLNHARRQVGARIYGAQPSYLPLKVNMAGVMPAIFGYAIITFPATAASLAGAGAGGGWMRDIIVLFQQGTPLYFLTLGAMVIFFAFFFVSLTYNPREHADTLKKSGSFIPGIRPGEQTAQYLGKVILRLTMFGAVYIAAVVLLPELVYSRASFLQFFGGGTSILIMVVVAMDFMEHIQHHLMTRQYGSLLKKMPEAMRGMR